MDCSLPGSSIHGIFQARVLEWGAIAFSDLIKQPSPKYRLVEQIQLCALVGSRWKLEGAWGSVLKERKIKIVNLLDDSVVILMWEHI